MLSLNALPRIVLLPIFMLEIYPQLLPRALSCSSIFIHCAGSLWSVIRFDESTFALYASTFLRSSSLEMVSVRLTLPSGLVLPPAR